MSQLASQSASNLASRSFTHSCIYRAPFCVPCCPTPRPTQSLSSPAVCYTPRSSLIWPHSPIVHTHPTPHTLMRTCFLSSVQHCCQFNAALNKMAQELPAGFGTAYARLPSLLTDMVTTSTCQYCHLQANVQP